MSQVVDVAIRVRGSSLASAARRIAPRLPTIGLAVLLLVNVLLATNAIHVLRAGLAAVSYPFELDFAEGLLLTATRALADGRSIYPPAEEISGTISNYTPVYYTVVALLGIGGSDHLAVGRAISLASALLAAMVLAALTWRAIEPASGRVVRLLAAACAGVAFLQISYTASFAALMRVDLLAVLLAFAGVLVFGATAARGRQVYWCLIPLVLALYTKQSTIAAAAACVLTAARGNLRRGLALGTAFVAAVAVVAGMLQLGTRGGFAFHVISANLQSFSWYQAAAFLQDIAIRYPVLVALAVASVPGLLASSQRPVVAGVVAASGAEGGEPWRRNPSSQASGDYTRAVLGAYLPLVALTSIGAGQLGSEVNHLIELMGVVCVCAAVIAAEALRPLTGHSVDSVRPSGSAIAAIAVPILLLWQVDGLAPASSIESIELPTPIQQAQVADLVGTLRRSGGPVLSEDLTLLSRADKPVLFQPFDIAQLMYRHERDERPMIEALARGEFALVILRFDARTPPPIAFNRFTRGMIATIRARYAVQATYPGYWLYAPRPRSAAPFVQATRR